MTITFTLYGMLDAVEKRTFSFPAGNQDSDYLAIQALA
jgi:hypothetical protein